MGRGAGKRKWRQWREDEARAALAELDASGESLPRFAARRGLSARRLMYWRKRLGPSAPTFVAVRVGDARTTRQVEIAVDGVVVRVREDLDIDHVAQLAVALARRARC